MRGNEISGERKKQECENCNRRSQKYSSYSINPQQQKITDNLKDQQYEEHYRPRKQIQRNVSET
jgi:hypothetical protein